MCVYAFVHAKNVFLLSPILKSCQSKSVQKKSVYKSVIISMSVCLYVIERSTKKINYSLLQIQEVDKSLLTGLSKQLYFVLILTWQINPLLSGVV